MLTGNGHRIPSSSHSLVSVPVIERRLGKLPAVLSKNAGHRPTTSTPHGSRHLTTPSSMWSTIVAAHQRESLVAPSKATSPRRFTPSEIRSRMVSHPHKQPDHLPSIPSPVDDSEDAEEEEVEDDISEFSSPPSTQRQSEPVATSPAVKGRSSECHLASVPARSCLLPQYLPSRKPRRKGSFMGPNSRTSNRDETQPHGI
ncbi:hypothetical protein NLI96_g9520 [Meripilus lineatus]|uniref:Uncharacterized protein n=1 Tax=Meripilus lineatus TaxID=2056292 RepID=A0AAD5V0I7_9APHY|nr:hypothetical protein NLI96_g9520 [Physisporinus lineatus]